MCLLCSSVPDCHKKDWDDDDDRQLTCFRALSLLGVAVLAAVRHHEDVGDARLFAPGLHPPGLAELLGPEVEESAGVVEEGSLAPGGELAESAGVAQTHSLRSVSLSLTEVREQDDGDLVTLGLGVRLQLVHRVGVEVAGLAPQLGGVGASQHGELPFIAGTSFSDVIVERESGQVFICLAVELKVCLEICLVGAEFADVSPSQQDLDLSLPLLRSVQRDVRR